MKWNIRMKKKNIIALVDNVFLRVTFWYITLSTICYLYIHIVISIFSKMKLFSAFALYKSLL
jgi:hypothetical protein